MLTSTAIDTLIKDLEEEQNKLSNSLMYNLDDKNTSKKMTTLKHITMINNLMKNLITYNDFLTNPPKVKAIKKDKTTDNIKTSYGIKQLLNR